MLKNLYKFFNKHNIPWVNLIWETYYSNGLLPGQNMVGSFWWKANLKLLDLFKSMAICNIGDGKSALFWNDQWHSTCLFQGMPHLFSFTKNTLLSVQEAINFWNIWKTRFTYPCLEKLMRNSSNLRSFVRRLDHLNIGIVIRDGTRRVWVRAELPHTLTHPP